MIQRYKRITGRLLGLCLMILAAASCTYDYFEDETNFRIYIPQIKERSIDNVLIFIHDSQNNHCQTLFILANEFDLRAKDGIIRVKLPYGSGYKVSAFANITDKSCYTSDVKNNSYVSEPKLDNDNGVYTPGHQDTRVEFQNDIEVFPIGHPDAEIVDTVNLINCCKAYVSCEFKALPEAVKRIDIIYKGVATHLRADGTFYRLDNGYVKESYTVVDDASRASNTIDRKNPITEAYVFPSARLNIYDHDTDYEHMGPLVRFYDDNGGIMAEFDGTNPDDFIRPDGSTVAWNFRLGPQDKVKFVFNGFFLFDLKLTEWGDIEEGPVTPM